MIQNQINTLIVKAMKEKNEAATRTYRAVKTAFMEFTTAKERVSDKKVLDEAAEISIIKKMIKERTDTAEIYNQNGRTDLATQELEEIKVLETFLPQAPSEEELTKFVKEQISTYKMSFDNQKPQMGMIIKAAKQKFPAADGKMLSEIVKASL